MSAGHIVALAIGALFGGYAVGSIPVAWLLVRRSAGIDLRRRGVTGGTTTFDTLAVAGPRVAMSVIALELVKGAVVGLGAHAYDDTAWFTATAIAGCVTGDAYPIGLRHGRRGVVPLVSGTLAALPGAWTAGLVIAIPAILFFTVRGLVFESVVTLAVPGGFLLGTRDLTTLAPAALIVVVLVARSRQRRRTRTRAMEEWRRVRGVPVVIDAPDHKEHRR